MRTLVGMAVSLAVAGMVAGCDKNNTPATDLATAADLATASPDLATASPDLAQAGPDMAAPLYNNCTEAMFTDASAAGATRNILFGGATGNAYSPKCLLISAGQSVMWTGTFSGHPLRPGVGATATTGSPNNPIMPTNAGATVSFTFPTAGYYPFNCSAHDAGGMNGVIKVK